MDGQLEQLRNFQKNPEATDAEHHLLLWLLDSGYVRPDTGQAEDDFLQATMAHYYGLDLDQLKAECLAVGVELTPGSLCTDR